MRITFKVLRPGVASDGTFHGGRYIEFKYDASKIDLAIGELFSAEVCESEIDTQSIYLEERGQFESAATIWGQGMGPADETQQRGWNPGSGATPHNGGAPDQKPDTGDLRDRYRDSLRKEK
jgi:hypothetical protein